MELRLERFISSAATLSDTRNLDPFNPTVIQMEHPTTATQYIIIVSILEPSYMGIPINCIWVALDSTKPFYRKALKLKAVSAEEYEGEADLIDGLNQAWIEITTYDEIFSDPQYYANAGLKGEKGDKGDKGDTGETPVIDIDAIAIAVAEILGQNTKALVITGPNEVVEGASQQYIVNVVENGESTPIVAQITATTGAQYVTINSSNLVTGRPVTADQAVTLSATYNTGGKTLTATKAITVKNSDLSSIALTGLANSVFEGGTSQMTVTATYGNSSTTNVTSSATYAVNPTNAGAVNSSGLFTAAQVTADTNATITATYVEAGVTKTATASTQVKNIIPTALAINGASQVNENTTSQYTATVTRNDGTNATVVPTWSVGSGATINSSGLLTAAETSADVSVTISASYTESGVTVNATKIITVKNVAAVIYPYYGVAASNSQRNAALILSLPSRGPAGVRQMNPCSMTSGVGQSYWYAYPVSYGLATFVDLSNNFEGGMDGAKGDGGISLGPITVNVTIDGQSIPFYLYQSDKSNLGLTNWNVL